MKTRTQFLLLLFFILSSLQCKKNKPRPSGVLPDITHEGKNTFGCKIDGEVWIPYYKCPGWGSRCNEISVAAGTMNSPASLPLEFAIHVTRIKDGAYSSFEIGTHRTSPAGISTIGLKTDSLRIVYYDSLLKNYEVTPNSGSKFKFEITHLDTIQRIIAGTFEGVLYQYASDSVKITDGRFDFRFGACRCSD